jgi:hypothetical protein
LSTRGGTEDEEEEGADEEVRRGAFSIGATSVN